MLQQIIALIIILFFIIRLFFQKKKGAISGNEFIFWLIFWLISMMIISSLKWIDKFVANLGFSGPGIQVLIYISIVIIFYFLFRLRLRLEKIERDITKIVRGMALDQENNKTSKH